MRKLDVTERTVTHECGTYRAIHGTAARFRVIRRRDSRGADSITFHAEDHRFSFPGAEALRELGEMLIAAADAGSEP